MPAEVTRVASLRGNDRPVDPDVKIPPAVLRAKEAAEAAQRAAYPDGQPPAEAPVPPKNGDTITIADPPVATPPAPAAVTPQGNPPAPEVPPVPAPSEDSWEHKFKSSEGRVRALITQNGQLVDRLSAIEALMEDMRNQPAPAPVAAPTPPARLVTPEEENEFGTEMLDVMARRARETLSPELAEMKRQMEAMEAKLTGTQTTVKRNARQDMLAHLDANLPDWRRINDLNEFKAWLALPDPYFGVKRHTALLSAFEQNDTPRVLNFFKGFVSELAVTDPAPDLVLPTPAAEQPAKPGLASLAAPGRARTPAAVTPPDEKQIITTADVNAFYDAKRRGAYAGREAEFAQLEQELFKAQREGRVRAV